MSGANRVGRYLIDDVWRTEPLGQLLRGRLPERELAVYLRAVLPPSALTPEQREGMARQLREEAEALARARHPALGSPCDLVALPDGRAYLVFERPEREGFVPAPADPRALTADGWVHVAGAVCDALAAAQEAGLALPQFHPEGLFLRPDGAVRYLPLGLSHLALAAGLPLTAAVAQPLYAAPEALAGLPRSPATLVFSVAAWLYAMLAGDAELSVAARLLREEAPEPLWTRNPSVRAAVDEALLRALRREPHERFPDVRALGEALRPRAATAPASTRLAIGPPSPAPAGASAAEAHAEADGELPILLECLLWIVVMGVAGALTGWGLAQLHPWR